MAATVTIAVVAPTNTDSASPRDARLAVASCVRSPHSARNTTPNTVAEMRHHGVRPATAVASAARASASATDASSSASPAERHSTTAPAPNSTATAALTARSGSRPSSRPATTAMTICTVSADAAPIHTASGRLNRADSTTVASIVLSGSSATNTVANAVTIVAGCTTDQSTRSPEPGAICVAIRAIRAQIAGCHDSRRMPARTPSVTSHG